MKFSPSHTTYIEQATKILKFLERQENVSKISLGIIKTKKSMSKSFTKQKIKILENHILIKVNSKLAVQEIRVYGQNLEKIEKELIKNFSK